MNGIKITSEINERTEETIKIFLRFSQKEIVQIGQNILAIGTNNVIKIEYSCGIKWTSFIIFGIVTCFLPYFLYNLAMKDLPAGTASALGIVEPMAATVFSIVIFKEEVSVFSVIGIILILTAVFLLGKAEDGGKEEKV